MTKTITQQLASLKSFSLCCFSATILLLGFNAAHAAEAKYQTIPVKDGIYMLAGVEGSTGGNVGLSIGSDGIAMIDNGYSNVLEILRAEVAKLSDQPIDYLINTHVHGDHIGNNAALGDNGTRIISHENLRSSLNDKGTYNGTEYVAAKKSALPTITFADRMTLHINGDAAKIIHFSDAHTDGDAVIYFQRANVIHAGDILFNTLFPYIDRDNGGSLKGVITALKEISKIADAETKIIPGHGPLADKQDVDKTVAMLEDAAALVSELIAAGKSDDEILETNPLNKYQSYSWSFISTERMTKQMLANLR
jgi:glyoxylase-like metal-dependent hydrolase (beta-lactamase superfamily II)